MSERGTPVQCVGSAPLPSAGGPFSGRPPCGFRTLRYPQGGGGSPFWRGTRRRTHHRPDGRFAPSIHYNLDAPRRRVVVVASNSLDSVVYTPGRAGHPVTSASQTTIRPVGGRGRERERERDRQTYRARARERARGRQRQRESAGHTPRRAGQPVTSACPSAIVWPTSSRVWCTPLSSRAVKRLPPSPCSPPPLLDQFMMINSQSI